MCRLMRCGVEKAVVVDNDKAPVEAQALLQREGPKYQYGTGCLSDGVLGDWMARVSGVPAVLDAKKAGRHLDAIFAHNFREDLSDHANSVEIDSKKNVQDVTGFGSHYKENLLGLGDGSMKISLFQDFDAASVDATRWPIHDEGDLVEIVVKPSADAVSETNPSWTMTGVLPEYTPLTGSVGDASKIDATFQNADQSGIVRATA